MGEEKDIEELFTTWVNPTEHHFNFRIFMGPGQHRRIKIAPGQEIDLPSEYDNVIAHKNDRSNVVTSGLCPLLRKKSEMGQKSNVHPALLGSEVAPAPIAQKQNHEQNRNEKRQ